MARRRPPLGVWLYGMRVAEITPKGGSYRLSMRYSAEACDRWPGNSPILSCSLPLGRSRQDPTEYLRGLLPEGRHLMHLAARAKVTTDDLYGLLRRYGRDVAGAVVVSETEPAERPGDAVPYDGDALADEVAGLEERPLAVYDDSELSIPGLQNKLLLIRTANGWARPAGGRPSTHLLKVEDRRYAGLVTMEAAAMRLAKALGLTTADVEVIRLDGIDCIIVSRFDRTVGPAGELRRVHQEDVCQALGSDPYANQGRAKYERHGGPGLLQVAGLLDRHAADPQRELERLVAATTFTAIIGNGDAHGKNLSLLHVQPGVVELAPLYDTVPTVMWPKLHDRAAMSVNHKTTLSDVGLTDVVAEAKRWALDPAAAERSAVAIVERASGHLDTLPAQLAEIVRQRSGRFLSS